jgi:hypothetical protein
MIPCEVKPAGLRKKREGKLKNWQRELREADHKIASVRQDIENHPCNIEIGRETDLNVL